MKHPKVSIIIPVFGVEKYIAKCIQSILAQTMAEFEAIIIDDGSLDKSIAIAKSIVNSDARFIFLSKENGGIGSARNMGLDIAKGDYITFVDSDDYIEDNFLEGLYEAMQGTDAEVGVCDVRLVNEEYEEVKIHINQLDKYIQHKDHLKGYDFISNWLCDKVFKKSLFETMRFDETIRTFEDAHFTFRLIYNKKIIKIDKTLYNYLQRSGSINNSIQPSYLYDRIQIKNVQIKFAEEINLTDQDYINFVYLRTFVFLTAKKIAQYSKEYDKDIQQLYNAIDMERFTVKKTLRVIKSYPQVGLSLLILKSSPKAFRFIVNALMAFRGFPKT